MDFSQYPAWKKTRKIRNCCSFTLTSIFYYLERQETKRFVLVPFWPSLFLFCLSGCCFRYSRFGNKFLFFFSGKCGRIVCCAFKEYMNAWHELVSAPSNTWVATETRVCVCESLVAWIMISIRLYADVVFHYWYLYSCDATRSTILLSSIYTRKVTYSIILFHIHTNVFIFGFY